MILLSIALAAFAVAGLYASAQAARNVATAHRVAPTGLVVGALTACFAVPAVFVVPLVTRTAGYPGASTSLIAVTLPLAALALSMRIWVLTRLTRARSLGELIAAHYGRAAAVVAALIATAAAIAALTQVLTIAGALTNTLGSEIDPRHGVYFAALFLIFTAVPGGIATAARLARLHGVLFVAGMAALVPLVLIAVGGVPGLIVALDNVGTLLGGPTTGGRGGGDYPIALAIAGTIGTEEGWSSLDILGIQIELTGGLLALLWLPWLAASGDPRPLVRPRAYMLMLGFGTLIVLAAFALGLAGLSLQSASPGAADILIPIVGPTPWGMALIGLIAVGALHAFSLAILNGAISFLRPLWARRGAGPGGALRELTAARFASLILILAALLIALIQPDNLSTWQLAAWRMAVLLAMLLGALCFLPTVGATAVVVTLIVGAAVSAGEGTLAGVGSASVVAFLLWGRGRRDKLRVQRVDWHRATAESLAIRSEERSNGLRIAVLTMIWLFFALGPGMVIGNDLFGAPYAPQTRWDFAIPSLGVWEIGSWLAGCALFVYAASILGGRLTRDEWERLSGNG